MITISGHADTMNHVLYGHRSPYEQALFGNELQRIEQYVRDMGQVVGSAIQNSWNGMLHEMKNMYNKTFSEAMFNEAQKALESTGKALRPDVVYYLGELEDIQNAGMQMQRWIMAYPPVREMYLQQRLDGYSHSYINYYDNDIKDNHYDYRRVVNNVVMSQEDGSFIVNEYIEDLIENDRELTIHEKANILDTWEILDALAQLGLQDPTSLEPNIL